MKKITPNYYYKNVYEINYKQLKRKKIKFLIFDLDNTLVSPFAKSEDIKMTKFINELKKDFTVYIASNSLEGRVNYFAQIFDVEYVSASFKPLKKNLKKLIKKDPRKYAMIGDQVFTDVLVGNRLNLNTILVDPLANSDYFITKFNRKLETLFVKRGKYYE